MRRVTIILVIVMITYCPGEAPYSEMSHRPPIQKVSRGNNQALIMEATAYCHTGNPTRSGTWPAAGRTVAVDPEVIPLGTTIWVEGFGWLRAEDTGGDIKGNRIDIFMETKEKCIEFGRRPIKVVLGGGQPLGKPSAR